MKILYLILGLLVISQCQEKVLENWVSNNNAGFSKFFVKPSYDWSRTKDLAVYGWFKIDTSATLSNQSVLFHLTANVSGDASFNKNVGDFVFGVLYKDSKLSIGTYSTPNIPYYIVNNNIRAQDLDKWTFFYVAYSGSKNKLFYRFEFNNLFYSWGSVSGAKHNLSTYYKLFVGSQLNYSKFPGQISKVHIQAGTGAYRESGFSNIIPFNDYRLPSQSCPVIFDQCDYKGNYYIVCSSDNNVPPSFPIRSVFLPTGWTFEVHDEVGVLSFNGNLPCWNYNSGDIRSIFVHYEG